MAPSLQLPPPTQGTADGAQELVRTSTVEGHTFASGGIVFPPPDLRAIIDKTAEFVARNGVAFEAKIREQERMNPKFAFLHKADAYYGYFRMQIRAATEKKEQPDAQDEKDSGAAAAVHAALHADRAQHTVSAEPPRPEPHRFTLEFPSMAASELDVLKLAALFTARQGTGFASRLLAKEADNEQFAFLNPRHPLFSYFHLMVEQYRQVMQPSAQDRDAMARFAGRRGGPGTGGGRLALLPEVQKRAKWVQWDQERRQIEEDEEARRRAIFDEIDWQDFAVVGVVEITSQDAKADLPPARSLHELEAMAVAHEKMAEMHAAAQAEAARQAELEAEAEAKAQAAAAAAAPAPEATDAHAPLPADEAPQQADASDAPAPRASITRPTPQGDIKIRKDYVRSARPTSAAVAQTTVCPVCGDTVPVNEMGEHVRIELLNPKYREERAKIEERRQAQASVATGADPSHLLKQFAGARTDIFGAAADEQAQAKRDARELALAREKERHVWDGHANSTKKAQDARARGADTDQQLAALRQKAAPSGPEVGPQVPGKRAAPAAAEPPPKRRAEAAPAPTPAALYPETEWLAMYPHPITLHVQVPDAPHVAPACDGRVLEYSGLPQTMTVGQVRDRVLNEALARSVGASKLKMWVGGKPATLRQTLAFWNMKDGGRIDMSLAK